MRLSHSFSLLVTCSLAISLSLCPYVSLSHRLFSQVARQGVRACLPRSPGRGGRPHPLGTPPPWGPGPSVMRPGQGRRGGGLGRRRGARAGVPARGPGRESQNYIHINEIYANSRSTAIGRPASICSVCMENLHNQQQTITCL